MSEQLSNLTVRDYFAAEAPAEIPGWFKHKPAAVNVPAMPDWRELPKDHQIVAQDWLHDSCFDLGGEIPALVSFQQPAEAHWKAKAEARLRDEQERYIQWRYHYASMMLAERKRTAPPKLSGEELLQQYGLD